MIIPWNFPLHIACRKGSAALAAGNTVVLKAPELAPLTSLELGRLALEAGIPPGVFNVVPGLGEVAGAALVEHPDVNKIAFTGSTTTGRAVMRGGAGHDQARLAGAGREVALDRLRRRRPRPGGDRVGLRDLPGPG